MNLKHRQYSGERNPRWRFFMVAMLAVGVVMGTTHVADAHFTALIAGHGQHLADAEGSPDPEGQPRSVTLGVVVLHDAQAIGQMRLRNQASGVTAVVDVDCAVFTDDNTVIMSGTVSQVDAPDESPFSVGTAVFFAVRDLGNGRRGAPDRITPVFVFDQQPVPELCLLILELFGPPPDDIFAPIDRGNYVIQP